MTNSNNFSAKIPNWAQKVIAENAVRDIENEIGEIEKITTGEIIVLIAKESASFHYLRWHLSLFLIMIIFFMTKDILQIFWLSQLETILVYILGLLMSYLTVHILLKLSWVKKTLVHPLDAEKVFQQRAINEYYQNQLHKTKDNTAVLIMVSLLERKAVILASADLNKESKEGLWDDCIQVIIKGAQKKKLGLGILQALKLISPILKERFPLVSGQGNPDEIANTIIFKD
jgi:putative membrane protein